MKKKTATIDEPQKLTHGTIVVRKTEPNGKKGLVLFFDEVSKRYAVRWPRQRRWVKSDDLTVISFQATLF